MMTKSSLPEDVISVWVFGPREGWRDVTFSPRRGTMHVAASCVLDLTTQKGDVEYDESCMAQFGTWEFVKRFIFN